MITSAFLFVIATLIGGVSVLLPAWSPWPADLLTGLTYFFTNLSKFNIIFPVDTLLIVLKFIIDFEVAYFGAKLLMKVINFFRGAGSGLDI